MSDKKKRRMWQQTIAPTTWWQANTPVAMPAAPEQGAPLDTAARWIDSHPRELDRNLRSQSKAWFEGGARFNPRTKGPNAVTDGAGYAARAERARQAGFAKEAAAARGEKAPGTPFVSVNGKPYDTMSAALRGAGRVASNNARRREVLGLLRTLGASEGDLEPLKFQNLGEFNSGARFNDQQLRDIRGLADRRMQSLQSAHDAMMDKYSASKFQHPDDGGSMSRAAIMERLRKSNQLPGITVTDATHAKDRSVEKIYAAARAVESDSGRRRSGILGSSGASQHSAVFNASSKTTGDGGIRTSETGTFSSTGTGGWTSMGSGGSVGGRLASAIRGIPMDDAFHDANGRYLGGEVIAVVNGKPVFSKGMNHGFKTTSETEKEYRREVADMKANDTRLWNDSIMSGGAAADYYMARRMAKYAGDMRYKEGSKLLRMMKAYNRLAELGIPMEFTDSQVKSPSPSPSSAGTPVAKTPAVKAAVPVQAQVSGVADSASSREPPVETFGSNVDPEVFAPSAGSVPSASEVPPEGPRTVEGSVDPRDLGLVSYDEKEE